MYFSTFSNNNLKHLFASAFNTRYNKTSRNRKLKNNVQGIEKPESRDGFDNVPWVSRADIEISLTELQLLCNMQSRCVENNQDLALFIIQFTKSIAELPYK